MLKCIRLSKERLFMLLETCAGLVCVTKVHYSLPTKAIPTPWGVGLFHVVPPKFYSKTEYCSTLRR